MVAETEPQAQKTAVPKASSGSTGERPLLLTIVAILGFIGSIIAIVGGVYLIAMGSALAMIGGGYFTTLGVAGVAVSIVLGLVSLVAWMWTWKLQKKGMILVIILLLIGIANAAADYATQYLGIIVQVLFIIYLIVKRNLFK